MAKTPKEVDEEAIRGMMRGDVPRLNIPEEEKASAEVSASEDESEAKSEAVRYVPSGETAKPRRRKEPKDYVSAFLHKREPAQKRQTYISSAHFAKITEILAVVAYEISVPVFLDNLIEHHLEQNRDEVNALYYEKFKKPFRQ